MMKDPTPKTCPICYHELHGPGYCDRCNCGQSEQVFSKRALATKYWWEPPAWEQAAQRMSFEKVEELKL